MTIGPMPHDFYHPRTSSNQFSRDLDVLHRLVARIPSNSQRDINNNELPGDQFEICCNTRGFKPNNLSVLLNGGQLTVSGRQECDEPRTKRRCFGETFVLPENIDQQRIHCELNNNGRLSINMLQPRFEANFSSSEPFESASSGGGLW